MKVTNPLRAFFIGGSLLVSFLWLSLGTLMVLDITSGFPNVSLWDQGSFLLRWLCLDSPVWYRVVGLPFVGYSGYIGVRFIIGGVGNNCSANGGK